MPADEHDEAGIGNQVRELDCMLGPRHVAIAWSSSLKLSMPGGPFFANEPQLNTLRLSFVTVPPEKIRRGVAILGKLLRESIATARVA